MQAITCASSHRPGLGGAVRHPQPPPLRLTRRGRIGLVAAVAALALGVLWLGTHASVTASSGAADPSGKGLPWVTVRQGDTLWTIASAVDGRQDPGPTIREIMNLNGLSDSLIHPGRRLYLPSGM